MFKRNKKLSAAEYLLIVANLVPVAGVWGWGWSPKEVFLIYCLETIIIGLYTLIKLGIVTVIRKRDTWQSNGSSTQQSGLLFMLFFLVHYGLFVGIQMGIFFGVSGIGKEYSITAWNFFYKWHELIGPDAEVMLAVFVFSHGYRMVTDFLLSGQYRTISFMRIMFQPYGRIFIQQITVIVGSMFLEFGAGKVFILIFALVKIFFEIYLNLEELIDKGMNEAEKKSGDRPAAS